MFQSNQTNKLLDPLALYLQGMLSYIGIDKTVALPPLSSSLTI